MSITNFFRRMWDFGESEYDEKAVQEAENAPDLFRHLVVEHWKLPGVYAVKRPDGTLLTQEADDTEDAGVYLTTILRDAKVKAAHATCSAHEKFLIDRAVANPEAWDPVAG